MRRAFRVLACATSAVACGSPIPAMAGQTERTAVHVAIDDNVGLTAPGLDVARAAAAKIFDRADVDVVWTSTDDTHGESSPPLEAKRRAILKSLCVVRIVTGGTKLRSRPASLGFTVSGTRITAIVYPRVEALALRTGSPPAVVLGHVMAHELGHVLLGTTAHSAAGVMRPTLDVRLAGQGRLFFSDTEAAAIREHLRMGLTPTTR